MRHRRGFTLVEMVLASAIVAIILVGMQSAIMVASHAIPARGGTAMLTMNCGSATDQLAQDIGYATSFNTMTATTVEMVVPDRNGDGFPETIRYSWTGNSGDPLLRTINSGTAAAIVNDVRQFALGYVKAATAQPTPYTESSESLLFSTVGGSQTANINLTPSTGLAEGICPAISSTANYWRVTRVLFYAKGSQLSAGSQVLVQLRRPTNVYSLACAVADYTTVTTAISLLGYQWLEADFSGNAHFSPGDCVGISLLRETDDNNFYLATRTDAAFSNAAYGTSNDSGSSWSGDSSKAVSMYVYGVTGQPNAATYTYNLTQVTCKLRSGAGNATQIHSDYRVLNQPAVSGP